MSVVAITNKSRINCAIFNYYLLSITFLYFLFIFFLTLKTPPIYTKNGILATSNCYHFINKSVTHAQKNYQINIQIFVILSIFIQFYKLFFIRTQYKYFLFKKTPHLMAKKDTHDDTCIHEIITKAFNIAA